MSNKNMYDVPFRTEGKLIFLHGDYSIYLYEDLYYLCSFEYPIIYMVDNDVFKIVKKYKLPFKLKPKTLNSETPVTDPTLNLFDVPKGEKLREEGIKRAADHSGPDWQGAAVEWAGRRIRAMEPGTLFTMEEVRAHVYSKGLPKPPDERSWGAVARKLVNLGLCKPEGYVQAKMAQAHRGPKRQYRKL